MSNRERRRTPRNAPTRASRLTKDHLVPVVLAVMLALLPWAATTGFNDAVAAPKQVLLFFGAAALLIAASLGRSSMPEQRLVAVSLAAFAAWLVLASLLSDFPKESVLGWYGVRNGWTTWLAVVVVFFAAASISSQPAMVAIVRTGAMGGLLMMTLVALGQQTGAADALSDLRMETRNTGLAGTPNDLAACCIVYLGLLWPVNERPRLTAIGVAAAALAVLLSVSRVGVSLFVVALVLATALGWFALGLRPALRQARWLFGAAICGAVIALPTGTPAQLAGRFDVQIAPGSEQPSDLGLSGALRAGFWEAGLRAAIDSPVFGYGSDALPFIYGRHRSESETLDLYFDYALSSSHNTAIDLAVAGGLPAVLALSAGVFTILGGRLRHLKREPGAILSIAAVGGFGAMAMLNPLAIPQLVGFAVVLGLLTPASPFGRSLPRPAAIAAASLALATAAIAILGAGLLIAAEDRAAAARDASRDGEFARSANLYRSAAGIIPLERHYLVDAFVARIDAADQSGTGANFELAISAGEDVHREFAPLAGNLVALAGVIQLAHPGDPRVEALLAEAAVIEPASSRWAETIARIRTFAPPTGQ